ncbi:MAG TPA: chromate transporter [Anaerolineae bacterium]|nr:chromate transporter [Anaerolineae bacterium]
MSHQVTGRSALADVARLFLKLGVTAFGGPAAHIAMMHDEVVTRRKWLDEQHFLDLLGATNLIPGPNSTEMAIHIGFVRAGWIGLIVGGVCFILPAMLIVMALAWVYTQYGSTPAADRLLYGIKPIVIAIVAQALWGLRQKAIKGPLTASVGVAVLGLYFLGVNEIALLFAGGLAVMILQNVKRLTRPGLAGLFAPLTTTTVRAAVESPTSWAAVKLLPEQIMAAVITPFSLPLLFLTFLKIGAVLYGSGYVLLAFMRADFVTRLGWLTDQQLIDSIAIGQVTPGPVFTTATFVGYVLGGAPGALLATLGIFLPSFIFVALSNPLIPRLRESRWAGSLLDGVNVASLGLMAAVTLQLGQAAFVDPLTIGLGLIAAVLLLKFKLNSTWLVLGGALIGLASAVIH